MKQDDPPARRLPAQRAFVVQSGPGAEIPPDAPDRGCPGTQEARDAVKGP